MAQLLIHSQTDAAWPSFMLNGEVVPVSRFEAFRALKLSRLEGFRALKFIGPIERF